MISRVGVGITKLMMRTSEGVIEITTFNDITYCFIWNRSIESIEMNNEFPSYVFEYCKIADWLSRQIIRVLCDDMQWYCRIL